MAQRWGTEPLLEGVQDGIKYVLKSKAGYNRKLVSSVVDNNPASPLTFNAITLLRACGCHARNWPREIVGSRQDRPNTTKKINTTASGIVSG